MSGYVQDASSGERLPGAGIFCPETLKGTQSNTYGFFSIQPGSKYKALNVSYVGYKTEQVSISYPKDTFIIIGLHKQQYELGEVLVGAEKTNSLLQRSGEHMLASSQIEKIPMVLGETDILKAYQMLPGVQTGIQGTSGMVVRGSAPGASVPAGLGDP